MKIKKIAALTALALLPGVSSATVGYFAHGYGMKSVGMGGVGIALPQDSLAAVAFLQVLHRDHAWVYSSVVFPGGSRGLEPRAHGHSFRERRRSISALEQTARPGGNSGAGRLC